jgi:hypothetical protein
MIRTKKKREREGNFGLRESKEPGASGSHP